MITRTRLLAAAFLTIMAYAFDHLLWIPLSTRTQATEEALDGAHAKAEKLIQQARRLERLEKDVMLLSTTTAVEVERNLPKSRFTIRETGRFKDLARKDDVVILELALEKTLNRTYFNEISFAVTALAASRDIERLLKDLTLEERVLQVGQLTLGPPEANGKRRISFKLIVYQYRG